MPHFFSFNFNNKTITKYYFSYNYNIILSSFNLRKRLKKIFYPQTIFSKYQYFRL